MIKLKISDDSNWKEVIEDIINLFINFNFNDNKKMVSLINNIRDKFYILFVTNINIKDILVVLLTKLLEKIDNIQLKYEFINIITKYESRITLGTRYIVHYEGMIIELMNKYKEYKKK